MRALDIARSGLRAAERNLYVTAHNLSNANTEGYTRQRVEQFDSYSSSSNGISWGDGVDSSLIRRISNEFVGNIYRAENTKFGEASVRAQISSNLEDILGDPMLEKFSGTVEGIWTALNTLSRNPSDTSSKSILIQNANAFVDEINNINSQLVDLQTELDGDIKDKVSEINAYAKEIANLNKEIMRYELKGDQANDLRDRRDLAIEKLSEIVEIEIYEPNQYTADVYVGGTKLVSGDDVRDIVATTDSNSMFTKLVWSGSESDVMITGGSLKGLLDARGSKATGSIDGLGDGNVNDMVDLVVSVDTSMDLTEIKNQIDSMISKLDNKQLNYKLHFNIMGTDTIIDKATFDTEIEAIINDPSLAGNSDFITSNNAIKDIEFREGSSNYLMVISDKTIQNDMGDASIIEVTDITNTLKDKGLKLITVSDEASNWRNVANVTGGESYNIADLATEDIFGGIGENIVNEVNIKMTEGTEGLGIIPEFKEKLNGFVSILMREINSVLRQGRDNYGRSATDISDPPIDANGNHVFDLFVRTDANGALQMGNISVNQRYLDLNNIAIAGPAGNSDTAIAQQLVNIRELDLFASEDGLQNIDEFYEEFILDLGSQTVTFQSQLEVQTQLLNSAYERKQSIHAVSMDEELSNMIKFQQAYNAASKYLTSINEMLDTLIMRM